LHVEVCHIREINSFPDTAIIKEINDHGNLILLCRNCHWELDHGLLDLPLAEESNFRNAM
jgi:predicted HNH restriction endonuclease